MYKQRYIIKNTANKSLFLRRKCIGPDFYKTFAINYAINAIKSEENFTSLKLTSNFVIK